MTVEASIVMSVVILSLASLIRYAYTVHDTVTGGMILEETIERVRNNVDKKKTPDMFEAEGTRMGNPRLFLGEYTIGLKIGDNRDYRRRIGRRLASEYGADRFSAGNFP